MRHVTIEVEDDMKAQLEIIFKWGTLSKFMRVVLADIIIALEDETYRNKVIGGVVNGNIEPKEFIDLLNPKENDAK